MDQNFNYRSIPVLNATGKPFSTSASKKSGNGNSVYPLAEGLKDKKHSQTQKKADQLLDVFVDGLVRHGQTPEKAQVFKTNPKIRDQMEKEVKKLEKRTVEENLDKNRTLNLKDVQPRYLQPKVSYAVPNIERPKPWRAGLIQTSASKYNRPLVLNHSAFFGQDGLEKRNQGGGGMTMTMRSKSQIKHKSSAVVQARQSQVHRQYGKITLDQNSTTRTRSMSKPKSSPRNTEEAPAMRWENLIKIQSSPSYSESTKDVSTSPFDFSMSRCATASKSAESPLAANVSKSKSSTKSLGKSAKSLSKTKVGLSSKPDDSTLGPADVKEIASSKKVQKQMSDLELHYRTSLNPMEEPFSASLDLAGFLDDEISLQLDGRRITVTAKRVRRKDLNARKVTEILDVPVMVNMNSLKIGRTQAGVLIIEEVLATENPIPIN